MLQFRIAHDDSSGVYDFGANENNRYIAYPELVETLVAYLRREVQRLEQIRDEAILGPRVMGVHLSVNSPSASLLSTMSKPLRATVNCDMGEGFSLFTMGDDEGLMKTIHLANIACGFHASDFSVMNKTVLLAKVNHVLVGAHPSLPDLQGFGRREMAIEPDELASCFVYQVGALDGFLKRHGLPLNHIKPHGAIYGQTARNLDLARAVVGVANIFTGRGARPDTGVAFMGLAGTAHQHAAEELGVPFIAGSISFPCMPVAADITHSE
ncbi:LamB/YcsF family-domain-containing protein [Chiua virens]|nr:LamB/YcsF family-domain-containing protein [Chiua virens]